MRYVPACQRMERPLRGGSSKRQRGAFLIFTALALVVLLGFVGLSIDLSRQMLAHAQLQSSADACALAAVADLTSLPDKLTSVENADANGRFMARLNFPSGSFMVDPVVFGFSKSDVAASVVTSLNYDGSTLPSYVKCRTRVTNPNLFFHLAGQAFSSSDLSASAVATTVPSLRACLTPIFIRIGGVSPSIGMSIPYSQSAVESTFGVMNSSVFGGGEIYIGSGGWCGISFDSSIAISTRLVSNNVSAYNNTVTGWCLRGEGQGNTCSFFNLNAARLYTVVAMVDLNNKIIDSACVKLDTVPPATLTSTATALSKLSTLKIKYLGLARNDSRCISQGVPGSAGATPSRGPLVPALVSL